MSIRVLGTFQSRDAADSVRDQLIADGYNAADLIVMANRDSADPPESAELEPGTEGQGGFEEFQEKLGKAVLQITHHESTLKGDGTEGEATRGALVGVTVTTDAEAQRVQQMLAERFFAADVEIAQAD
jgi:hypothetical protein